MQARAPLVYSYSMVGEIGGGEIGDARRGRRRALVWEKKGVEGGRR